MADRNATPALDDVFAGLQDDREAASQYLSIFIDEAHSTLDELIEAMLALEAGGGQKNVEQLFIAAHRLKGSAASIGLVRIAKLAHLMEDVLQTLVDEGLTPTPQITDALLSCADGLRRCVNGLGSGDPETDRFQALAQELTAARATLDDSTAPQIDPPASLPVATEAYSANVTADLQQRVAATVLEMERDTVLVGWVVFEPALPLANLKARLLYEKLYNLGELRYFDPPLPEIEARETIEGIAFGVVTDKSPDAVRLLLRVAGVESLAVEPLTVAAASAEGGASPSLGEGLASPDSHALRSSETCRPQCASYFCASPKSPAPAVAAEGRPKPHDSAGKHSETLRVDIERLDQLMNLAGELTIGKARVAQTAAALKKALSENNLSGAREGVGNLFEAVRLLDRVSDGIQQGVMNLRMLPIGPLFGRFHRVIRDLTRANGKDIRLELSGENTELDKRMIDELGDPMIHMIRNAADHGIESPAERVAAGKPRQGTISLSAFHRGSSIVIRVSDDGRGLDSERIRRKAVERGLVSAADAERMTPQQLQQFVWLPGLSTADKVTEVSGRGVGMDIVRSKIEELNGLIDVESEPGRGTTITVKLPLTLAILPSLMVEIDGDVFAVPLESVLEIVRIDRRDMNTVHGCPMASVRDRIVSVIALGNLFRWRRGNKEKSAADEPDSTILVIIGERDRQLGLAVDNVLGEEDVVIKSIADNFRNLAGIAGASILGDGRVSLILDPPTLIEMSSRPGLAAATALEKVS